MEKGGLGVNRKGFGEGIVVLSQLILSEQKRAVEHVSPAAVAELLSSQTGSLCCAII